MKLKDIGITKKPIQIEDKAGNKMDVLLTSMTVADIEERNKHFNIAQEKSLAYARERAPAVEIEIQGMAQDEIKRYLYEISTVHLNSESDLLDVENEDVKTAEQIKEDREKEIEKIKAHVREEIEKMDAGDQAFKAKLYKLRTIHLQKFEELMEIPSLILVVKDPDTLERLLSTDPESENYIGAISEDTIIDLSIKSYGFRHSIDAMGTRRLTEDPNFLLLSPLARNAA